MQIEHSLSKFLSNPRMGHKLRTGISAILCYDRVCFVRKIALNNDTLTVVEIYCCVDALKKWKIYYNGTVTRYGFNFLSRILNTRAWIVNDLNQNIFWNCVKWYIDSQFCALNYVRRLKVFHFNIRYSYYKVSGVIK